MTTITHGFTFVDTRTQSKTVILPAASGNANKMFFIKDKYWTAGTNNIVVKSFGSSYPANSSNYIDPNTFNPNPNVNASATTRPPPPPDESNYDLTFTISHNGGCLILVCDGNYYWIANYCNPTTQFLYGASYTTTTTTAYINKFNTTSADSSNKKGIYLPTPSSGAICIVAMYPNGTSDMFMYILTPIDNSTQTNPYIPSTSSQGNPSATFISDGTTWYSAGAYNGAAINLSNQTHTGTTPYRPANVFANVDGSLGQSVYGLVSLDFEPQGLRIMKNIQTTASSPTTKYYKQISGVSSIVLRGRTSNTNNSISCGAANSCIWFYAYWSPTLLTTLYWPIITYVP